MLGPEFQNDTSSLRGGFRAAHLNPPRQVAAAGAKGIKRPGAQAGAAALPAAAGPRGPAGVISAAPAGPTSKKRKKKGKGGGGGGGGGFGGGGGGAVDPSAIFTAAAAAFKAVAAQQAVFPDVDPEVVSLNFKIGQAVRQGQTQAAVTMFCQNAEKLDGIRCELVDALMGQGKFSDALKVVKAAKKFGPLPHRSVIASLLAMPQDIPPTEAEKFVDAVAGAALWPSKAHENYFCHIASATVHEFIGEAARKIESVRCGGSCGALSNVRVLPKKGNKEGEIDCGLVSTGGMGDEGSGFFPTDAVSLTPLDSQVKNAGGICECEVVVGRPLILRAVRRDHPYFKSAVSGSELPFRVDKLANRTGYTRMMAALHCLLELDRNFKENKLWGRLPAAHRPGKLVRLTFVDPASHENKRLSPQPEVQALDANNGGCLNESQMQATASSLAMDVSLVQGPPGTGKTSTCVQILKLWVSTWKKPRKKSALLATSDSNIAVDNLLEGLVKAGVHAVRLGHPDKAQPGLLEHTADAKAAKALGVASLKDEQDRHRKREAVQKVIEDAEVVCCTSIGAGAGLLAEYWFPRVLVDEASQATEPSTLVPICRGADRVVLVGDHCQLPPTVSSDIAAKAGLSLSLFERLQQGGIMPVLLAKQYRMHPEISAFPCSHFYAGRIEDGIDGGSRPLLPGFPWPNPEVPICVLPVPGFERGDGTSFSNEAEASAVLVAARQLLGGGLATTALGIVAPYVAQVRLIRRRLQGCGIPTGRDKNGVEVGTVDGFQGREKEAIIMSTVRASPGGGIGFVADWRRANVAFTRAKRGLVVACQPMTLARDKGTWLPWLHWAKEKWCDGGKIPQLPPLQASAPGVGLAELERTANERKVPSFADRPRRNRSPSPEWKKADLAKAKAKAVAKALAKTPLQKDAMALETRPEERHFENDEDDDDDRHDGGAGEGKRGSAFGNIASSLGALGYGVNRGRARPGLMAHKGSPSPFLGGAKMDLASALTSKLGVKALVPTMPKAKAKPPPKKKKKTTKPKAKASSDDEGGGGGGLGLGGYASSSSDEAAAEDEGEDDDDDEGEEEEEEEEEDDDEDEVVRQPGAGAAAALPLGAAQLQDVGAAESSDESDDSAGIDLLDEFLH